MAEKDNIELGIELKDNTSSALSKLTAALTALTTELQKTNACFKVYDTAIAKVSTTSAVYTEQAKTAAAATAKVAATTAAASKVTQSFTREQMRLQYAVRRVNQALRSTFMMFGAPLLMAEYGIIRTGVAFQRVESNISSLVGGNQTAVKALKDQAMTLSTVYPISANKIFATQGLLISSNEKYTDVLKETSPLLKLATAGQMDLADAAGILLSAIRAFGIEGAQYNAVLENIGAASVSAGMQFKDFGAVLESVGVQAKSFGIPLKTVLANIAALKKEGFMPSEISSSLAAMYSKLVLAKSNKELSRQMAAAGVKLTADGKQLPISVILKEIKSAKITPIGMETLFGSSGMLAAGGLLRYGADNVDKLQESFANLKKILEELNDKQLKNLPRAWDMFKNSLAGTSKVMTEAFTPAFIPILNNLTALFNELAKSHKTLAGFLGFLGLGTGLSMSFAAQLSQVVMVFVMMSMYASMIGSTLLAVLTPLLVVLGSIAAAIGLILLLYRLTEKYQKYWETPTPVAKKWMDYTAAATKHKGKRISYWESPFMQQMPMFNMPASVIASRGEPFAKAPPTIASPTIASPTIAPTSATGKQKTRIDIHVHDKQKIIKSISTDSPKDLEINTGTNMVRSHL